MEEAPKRSSWTASKVVTLEGFVVDDITTVTRQTHSPHTAACSAFGGRTDAKTTLPRESFIGAHL